MTTLLEAIAAWLPEQRWWAGSSRPIAAVDVESRSELSAADGARCVDVIVAVDHRGDVIRYQVPVTLLAEADPERAHAFIGSCDEGEAYDSLHEQSGTQAWIQLAAGEGTSEGLGARQTAEVPTDLQGRPVGVEQSNSSVVYSETVVLKAFRRLAPGQNPDLEVAKALAGTGVTPEPLAWITGEVMGTPTTLALVQPWLRGATDGWKMATASVRDLFAEGDLHADEVGGDFASDSFRIGETTARMHQALAEAMPTQTADPDWLKSCSEAMHDRLDAASMEVPELTDFAEPLRAIFDALLHLEEPVKLQRIHGDLHLGQVLRNGPGWHIIDFEGEPSKPLEERTALAPALRDVAGMLRSFDYVSQALLAEQHDRLFRAHQWADRNRAAFCDGYAAVVGTDPRDQTVMLKAWEADKAIYEAVYESRHRPTWLPIPLAGLERIVP